MWLSKFTDPLCRIDGDKFVHLLACQLIAFVVGKALSFFMNRYASAVVGLAAAVTVGFFKELRDDKFDYDDFKFDIIGAASGAIYFLT